MSKKKTRNERYEVRVTIVPTPIDQEGVQFHVHDRSGMLAQSFCASRRDVAREATRVSALALNVPEGRIKIKGWL